MSYRFKELTINKLSIIGAGQIGPDICLHFSKVFWKDKVELVLVDISPEALQRAGAKIEKKIAKGVETGAFKPAMAESMQNSISYTSDYSKIAGSAIVLEAATEDEKIKDLIFKQVEEITADHCLFLSNSSHMQPEVIFRNVKKKERCLVSHYFFPAERNPVVEIVPGEKTSPIVVEQLMGFYEAIGKVPIRVKSSYGYAIDPIFEGLCQTAILCLEKGFGPVKEIDAVARKALGLGVGPFTALALTGGNPITNHGLDEMNKLLIPWFRSPKALRDAVRNNTSWEIAKRGEKGNVSPEKEEVLKKQFLGAYFALASYIIDLGITNISDLDMATEIALVVKAPFSLMNKMGIDNAYSLTKQFCDAHPEFPFPRSLEHAKSQGGWKIPKISRSLKDNVAVLTIRRPKVLNALNLEVLQELKEKIEQAQSDSSIAGIVITGFGVKAFVSGADLSMLTSLKTPQQGYDNSTAFQAILNDIQKSDKPVVCALNGIAFGGGIELAMACTARIAKKGLPVLACQPEVNLGFIPGAGGTQRLPRIIGIDKAAELLRTGRPVSSKEAVETGLIYKEAEGNLIDEAVSLAKKIAKGEVNVKPIPTGPMAGNGDPQAVNIGHLSKKIDAILSRAIYEGAKMSLVEGLELEARLFGECLQTEDMKIGLENFKKNGPRVKAEFVHS